MKNLSRYFLMLFAIGSMAAFTSCGGDDDDPPVPNTPVPSLEVKANGSTSTPITITEGESVTFTWVAAQAVGDDSRNLENFKVTVTGANAGGINTSGIKTRGNQDVLSTNGYSISQLSSNRNSYLDTLVIPANQLVATGNTDFTFRVKDRNNQVTERTIRVIVQDASAGLQEYTGKIINNNSGPSPGAYDLVGNVAVSTTGPTAVQDLVDRGIDNSQPLASNWRKSWTSANGTMFVINPTLFDYNNATAATLQTAYTGGTPVSVTGALAVGDIIIAKVRGNNQYMAIKVTAVNNTASNNNDNIQFSYKKEN